MLAQRKAERLENPTAFNPDFRQILVRQLAQIATSSASAAVGLTYADWNGGEQNWLCYQAQPHSQLSQVQANGFLAAGEPPGILPISPAQLQAALTTLTRSATQPSKAHSSAVVEEVAKDSGLRKFRRIPQLKTSLGSGYGCALGESAAVWLWGTPSVAKSLEVDCRSLIEHLRVRQEFDRLQAKTRMLEQMIQQTVHQMGASLSLLSLHSQLPDAIATDMSPALIPAANDQTTQLLADLNNHLDVLANYGPARLHLIQQSLSQLVNTSLNSLQPWLQQKQIQVQLPTVDLTLWLDPWQIRQVIDNLMNNAIAFSPPGSRLTWHWRAFQQEVLVSLSDQGPGFAPEDAAQLFQPTYTKRPGGHGLGLAIVQKIVLDHQGRCWAKNLAEGGAQFSFSLKQPLPI
jgi:signal transduction histidine kinase